MNTAPTLLAFDTSTDRLSIALVHRGERLEHSAAGGALASASLIPSVLRLLAEAGLALGDLDAIVFGRGPGSFTGLRTACAVAQGFGFGADVPLLPIDTLAAVAEEARARFGAERLVALLDARMDQVYVAHVAFDGSSVRAEDQAPRLADPAQVVVPPGWALAGNAFAAYGARLPAGTARHEVWPTAAAMLRLAPAMLAAGLAVDAADALPLYVRDKVAETSAERAARAQPAPGASTAAAIGTQAEFPSAPSLSLSAMPR